MDVAEHVEHDASVLVKRGGLLGRDFWSNRQLLDGSRFPWTTNNVRKHARLRHFVEILIARFVVAADKTDCLRAVRARIAMPDRIETDRQIVRVWMSRQRVWIVNENTVE